MQDYTSSCTWKLGDPHRKIQSLHLFINVEAMVKKRKQVTLQIWTCLAGLLWCPHIPIGFPAVQSLVFSVAEFSSVCVRPYLIGQPLWLSPCFDLNNLCNKAFLHFPTTTSCFPSWVHLGVQLLQLLLCCQPGPWAESLVPFEPSPSVVLTTLSVLFCSLILLMTPHSLWFFDQKRICSNGTSRFCWETNDILALLHLCFCL